MKHLIFQPILGKLAFTNYIIALQGNFSFKTNNVGLKQLWLTLYFMSDLAGHGGINLQVYKRGFDLMKFDLMIIFHRKFICIEITEWNMTSTQFYMLNN